MNIRNSVTAIVLTGLTICGSVVVSSAQSVEPREYPVYLLQSAPTVDGRVEGDAAWATLPVDHVFLTPFIDALHTNLPAYKQTSFKIGYDDHDLYVAVIATEPWTKYLNRAIEPEAPFERDDGIEILLNPKGLQSIQTFVVNANGERWSPAMSLTAWEAAVQIQDEKYSVEVRIPFGLLGVRPTSGEKWKANIVRNTNTIISPEDRQTSWSPAHDQFDDPAQLGRLVFIAESLTRDEVFRIEDILDYKASELNALYERALRDDARREDSLAAIYRATVAETSLGLTGITKGVADLVEPPNVPEGEVWRYGLGFPLQISPTRAALLTNIRMEGSGNIDFEIGTDVILFDDVDAISSTDAIPVSRFERYDDPDRGAVIVRKGPIIGGFVPLGAVLEDGTPHPAAGTGFGMCWAISHELDENGKFDYTAYFDRRAVLYQFSYDGEQFHVVEEKKIDASTLLPEWNLVGNFVTNAIPDGEDLLYVMLSRVGKVSVAGYTRWAFVGNRWQPLSFTPVTGTEVTWSEPSLIRDRDGSLLFSARSYDRAVPTNAFDIAVWQSTDSGSTWSQIVYEKNRRARSPVSINRTVDGTPFIAANTPPLRRTREVLSVWPLDTSRTRLEGRFTARDAPAEFGPAPSGSWWRIDHPTSAVLRLADGAWHSVLVYRIVDNGEVEGNAPPAPQTGCYVEEVFSAGEEMPAWTFE